VRQGAFERDQRAGTVRFAAPGQQPGGQATDLTNFGPGTVFTRGTQLKVQDVDTLHAQSDLTTKFKALGFAHSLQAGVDVAHEEKTVYAARNAAQGGVNLAKPTTLAGTPNDGAWIDESQRVLRVANQFTAKAWGAYLQDLVQVAPHWKLLGGLRYDRLDGRYDQFNIPAGAAGPVATVNYRQKISEWSQRAGVLYQPSDRHSFHFSYGTSFNTSGDAYSYNAQSANTPPERSENIELGARIDSADRQWTTRLALFRATKKNERNTDPDTAASRLLLSGKRHSAGLEVDVTGRLTPKWEIYGSYMWLPVARVDVAASTATTLGNRVGGRQAPADVTAPPWEAPSFVTADLMAEYTINQAFTLKANVSNVTDRLYAESLYRGHYIPGAGRLVQVSLTARF
jgi:catecholate siderophore receptor